MTTIELKYYLFNIYESKDDFILSIPCDIYSDHCEDEYTLTKNDIIELRNKLDKLIANKNLIDGIEYEKDIGYIQYKDRK